MDPDANVKEQEYLIDLMRSGGADSHDRARLRELRAALKEWLARGGFKPSRPQPPMPRGKYVQTHRSGIPVEELHPQARARWEAEQEIRDRTRVEAQEEREMRSMLQARGYDPKDAKKLLGEGMGPEELAHRLGLGGRLGLEHTHNLRRGPSVEVIRARAQAEARRKK